MCWQIYFVCLKTTKRTIHNLTAFHILAFIFPFYFHSVIVLLLFVISIKHCSIVFIYIQRICMQCSGIMYFLFTRSVFAHFVCSLKFLRFRYFVSNLCSARIMNVFWLTSFFLGPISVFFNLPFVFWLTISFIVWLNCLYLSSQLFHWTQEKPSMSIVEFSCSSSSEFIYSLYFTSCNHNNCNHQWFVFFSK